VADNPTMSLACSRPFSLTIASLVTPPVPYFWWPMEEASGDRVDVIHGLHFVPVGAFSNIAGKVGNALYYVQSSVSHSIATQANNSLRITSLGFSMVFWVNFKVFPVWFGGDDSGAPSLRLFLINLPSAFTTQLRFGSPEPGSSWLGGAGGALDVAPVPLVDTWYFVHWFMGSDLRPGYQINNGAETLMDPITISGDSSGGAFLRYTIDTNPALDPDTGDPDAVAEEIIIDEVAFFPSHKLTAAELLYLYNSGAGRTYPFT